MKKILVASVWLGGCSFLLTSSAPPEVIDALPLPDSAIVDSTECLGTPGQEGYLCVIKGTAGASYEAGAAEGARTMDGWTETSWDWVPGRVQGSWQKGDEQVSVAFHEEGRGSVFSAYYTVSSATLQPTLLHPRGDPGASLPDLLASVRPPEGAILLGAEAQPTIADAWWRVEGDPEALLAAWPPPGTRVVLRARSTWSRSVAWVEGDREYSAAVFTDGGGEKTLWVRTYPASTF